MNLSAPFIHRPVATTLLTLGLSLAGMLGFSLLPIAPLPQVDFPTIVVSANLPGASPETMAATVATPLERVLGTIAGVNEMTSRSALGSSSIVLQFDANRNVNGAARDVQAAINAARTLLPTGMPSNPSYRKVNPSDAPIMLIALTSTTLTRGQMYDAASTVIAQRLSQLNGVGQVTVGGGALPAVRVALNPHKLASQGIALDTVRQSLVASNVNRPKGAVSDEQRSWQITANDQARTAADYAPIVLSSRGGNPVYLKDVASVTDSVQDVRNYGIANGKPAIILSVLKEPGSNIIETVQRVRDLLPRLQSSVSPAISLDIISDRTTTVLASIHEVERAIALAIGLVVLVVLVFLRRWRATMIPALTVPVSLAATFGAMYLLGYSMNNISAMALTVATGLIVDDAIVVLENINRLYERGMSAKDAALQGAKEIGFTVVSISLSLVAVFIPLIFMGGVVGRMFREFAMVMTVAILVSMVVSLTTTPMMAALLLGKQKHLPPAAGGPSGFLDFHTWLDRWFTRLFKRGYQHSLIWALRHPVLMLAVLAGVIYLNIQLYATIPKTFFPQQDTGLIVGGVQADQGSSFGMMRARVDTFMRIIQTDPAVANVSASTGGGQSNTAGFYIALKPLAQREVSSDAVIARLRGKLSREAGANLFLVSVQDIRIGGRQANAQYQFTLQSDDLESLRTWEPLIRNALSQLPEVTDVNTDQQDKGQQTSLTFDREAIKRLGLSVSVIDNTLNNAFGQRQVGVIYNELNQYRVIMELDANDLRSPDTLNKLYFTSNTGKQVPLSAFASVQTTNTPLSINHQGGTPASTISFNLAPNVSLSQGVAATQNAMSELGVPVGVRGVFAGAANAFQQSLASQPWLIAAALLTIYLLLGVLYESLIHPITILSTLPSAGVGALLALMLFNTEFSVIALIGIILLIGIVKKNAIMMIDLALHKQRSSATATGSRMSAAPAIFYAALRRVRPILMTTLAAMLGALPLALGVGDGAELRQPLGIAIVGGLALSQLLTLLTTPVVFVMMDKLSLPSRWFRRAQSKQKASQLT